MHAQIDATGQQCLVDLLGEHALATDIGKCGVLGLATVAAGGKHLDLDAILGHAMRLGQEAAHQFRLGEGQRAATRSDPGEGEG